MDLPALALTGGGAVLAQPSGDVRTLSLAEARNVFAAGDVLTCHAMFVAQRLGARPAKPLLDVLELFAFAHPGLPCLPSPVGLARALGLKEPRSAEDAARSLSRAATALLDGLLAAEALDQERARKTAVYMSKAGWRWG